MEVRDAGFGDAILAPNVVPQSQFWGYDFPKLAGPYRDLMPETLSPKEWIGQVRSDSVRKKRELLVRYWVEANRFSNATDGIHTVRSNGELYRSINKAMELLESRKMAPNTLAQWRGAHRDFLRACVRGL